MDSIGRMPLRHLEPSTAFNSMLWIQAVDQYVAVLRELEGLSTPCYGFWWFDKIDLQAFAKEIFQLHVMDSCYDVRNATIVLAERYLSTPCYGF